MSAQSLDPDVRELLAAIRDAINVPQPADYADEHKFKALQRERVMTAVGTIDAILVEGFSPEIVTGTLRDIVREKPVTYRPYVPEAQDSPAEAVTR